MSTITESIDVGEEQDSSPLLLSVVIPCLNEAENIELCVELALAAIARAGIAGEVVVADNGSEDGSAELAESAGARVVHQPARGYGSAYLAGFAAARGEYIVMADADLTYDFADIPRFLAGLEDGADMVVGDRMANIHPGAMPWLHRYIGNPLLSGFLNVLFRTGIRDAHCGMRAVRRDRLEALGLRTTGMEFASEMIVRAARRGSTSARSRSSTTRVAANPSCRASVMAGGTCASCCCTRPTTCSSCPASLWRRSVRSPR